MALAVYAVAFLAQARDIVRALYLNAPGIRIHGTYSLGSIGTYASHGCIRMSISDSEELYELVDVGIRVIVKP